MADGSHGITFGIETIGGDICIALKAFGRLTEEDHASFSSMIDSTLDLIRIAEVRILIDITELEGWEPSAAWEEFRLDLRHGRRFDRIAIYGSRGWENSGASIAGWFLTGEVKHFADIDTALRWLSG